MTDDCRWNSIKLISSKAIRHLGSCLLRLSEKLASSAAPDDLVRINLAHDQPVKLHFGCGPRVLKDWINIDLKYQPFEPHMKFMTEVYYPEEIRGGRSDFYAFDVTKSALPLEDNRVDVIFHEDFLEHLTQKQQMLFLSETFRVLKKGGIHRVNTPDLAASMGAGSDFSRGFSGVFVSEWDKHGHFNVLTPTMLEEMARMVGYSEVLFNGRDQSISKEIPLEYRPSPNKPHRVNIFADLIK